MSLPPAESIFTLDGYDHLDVDDRPYYGIGGLSDGQRLANWFYLEAVMRKLYALRMTKPDYVAVEFSKLDQLPTDR